MGRAERNRAGGGRCLAFARRWKVCADSSGVKVAGRGGRAWSLGRLEHVFSAGPFAPVKVGLTLC